VIAIDTNILVYAHRRDSAFHAEAVAAMRRIAEGREAWALPWPCLHEFVAVVTHPRIYRPPSRLDSAIDQVDAWLEAPNVTHGSQLSASSTACASCGRPIATSAGSQT
jgi:predicted nucleic acid-binding protein